MQVYQPLFDAEASRRGFLLLRRLEKSYNFPAGIEGISGSEA
jgi:hypothetical protein